MRPPHGDVTGVERLHPFLRAHRLRSRAELDMVFKEGVRSSRHGLLLVLRRNDLDHPRLGISIGRRFGNAVMRNRAKRLLREAFRLDLELLPKSTDMVAVPRNDGFPDHMEAVRKLLAEAAAQAETRLVRREARDETP